MTWDELKEQVEKALTEAGMDGSIEIEYIDISYPTSVSVYTSDYQLAVV